MKRNLLLKLIREIINKEKNAGTTPAFFRTEVVTPADEETVDSKQLQIGIEVEMEHTTSRKVAKRIALQHLAEDPKYYTKLSSLGL